MDFLPPPVYSLTQCSHCGNWTRDFTTNESTNMIYCSMDCLLDAQIEYKDTFECGDFEFRSDDDLFDGQLMASDILKGLI
jgi:hypothetical protein